MAQRSGNDPRAQLSVPRCRAAADRRYVLRTLRRRTGTKTQDPAEQARTKASDRLRMVKVAVEDPVRETLIVSAAEPPEVKP